MIKLKADAIAGRSFADNLDYMYNKNLVVVILAFVFMLIYFTLALGYFPSKIYLRFSIAFTGIIVITLSFLSACGTIFYLN